MTLGNTVMKGKKKMSDHSLAVEAGLIKENPNPYYEAHLYASGSKDPFFPGDVPVAPPALLKGTKKNPGWRHGEQMEDDPFSEYFDENVEGDENGTTA